MQFLIKLLFVFLLLQSCSNESPSDKDQPETNREKQLEQMDFLDFRRAYHGYDTLFGKELAVLMNRNPEPSSNFSNSKEHPFYQALVDRQLIVDGNLNLSAIDTLPSEFDYQISPTKKLRVENRLMEYSDDLESPSYELTFFDKAKVVLIDTLAYGFPPDVTFFTMDLNNDGTDELLTLYRWYIINGDNFGLTIFDFKE